MEQRTRPIIHVLLLTAIGMATFAVGAAAEMQVHSSDPPHSSFDRSVPIVRAAVDAMLVTGLAAAAMAVGWRRAACFGCAFLFVALPTRIAIELVPRFGIVSEPWSSRVWIVPVVFAAVVAAWLAISRSCAESFWRPIDNLLRQSGWAGWLVAIALSIRVALGVHAFAPDLPATRAIAAPLHHAPAPPEYQGLSNPLEDPKFAVILEDRGDDPDAVRAVVATAVPHRTTDRAAALAGELPQVIVASIDESAAHDLAARLREAGANAAVRDALEWFAESVAADRTTPIGRPSEVLDVAWLESGSDALSELRTALADSGSGDRPPRDLVRRAYVALAAAEGRALYQTNCRPCHGTTAAGAGPLAAGFALRPANLRHASSIAQLTPGEMLWRIEQGAAGLPAEATPWHSSMPAWKHEFDRDLVWKIVLGEFSTADAQPARSAHAHAQHAPAAMTPPRQLPAKSWLEWPVPAKPTAETMKQPEFLRRGQYLYYFRCMPCHGVQGRGDGPAADTMWPRPRDFTTDNFPIETLQPKFKFRTTKQGWLPTDEDLYRTISRGLTGTAMEGWDGVMSPDEIWQTIAYLKTLSPAWNDPNHDARNPNDPVVVKRYTEFDGSGPVIDYASLQPPPVSDSLITEGRDVYLRFRCYECHGVEARGDGGALGQHYDDWGYRLWPQNLANPFNFKAGHSIKDIYRSFANSLDGTVMPVYSAKILDSKNPAHGEHMQWALAAYVHSQVQMPPRDAPGAIMVRAVKEQPPLDPADPRWQRCRETIVPLSAQVLAAPRWPAPSVGQVAARAMVDAESLALWFRWDDRRPNVTHQEMPADLFATGGVAGYPKTFATPALRKPDPVAFDARDQFEVQVPVLSTPNESAAARQPDSHEHAANRAIPEPLPPLFFGSRESPVALWRWRADQQGLTVQKKLVEISGIQAERIECSSPEAGAAARPIQHLRARGPEHIAELPADRTALSQAHWDNGAWTIVLHLPGRSVTNTVESRELSPIALHVWDGLAGEADLRMALSGWVPLGLEQPRSMGQHLAALAAGCAVLVVAYIAARSYRRRANLPA